MEHIKKTHEELGGRPNPLALRGMGLFIRASREAPANAFRQARLIAEHCDRRGLNAQELGTALMQDNNALERVVKVANRAHERSGANALPVNIYSAQAQVNWDFTIAAGLQSRPFRMR